MRVNSRPVTAVVGVAILLVAGRPGPPLSAAPQVAAFVANVTPPVGKPVGLGFVPAARTVEHPLLAKGIVLKDTEGTYVLCAIDWMEVHNSSYDLLRDEIARAADTTASRVAVHCVHQHTAPAIDTDAQRLLLPENDPRRIATSESRTCTPSGFVGANPRDR